MLAYSEQSYPVSINVEIEYKGDKWEDSFKGLNIGHALWNARENFGNNPEYRIKVI